MKKIKLIGIMLICMLGVVGCKSTGENIAVELDQASYDKGARMCEDTIGKDKKVSVDNIVDYTVKLSTSGEIKDEASFIDGYVDVMYDDYNKPVKMYNNGGDLVEFSKLDTKDRIFDLVIIRPESNYEQEDIINSLKELIMDDVIYNKNYTLEYGRDEIRVEEMNLTDEKFDGYIGLKIIGPEENVIGVARYNIETGDYEVKVDNEFTR